MLRGVRDFSSLSRWALAFCCCWLSVTPAQAQSIDTRPVAFEGYSLVSYFTEGVAEQGSTEFFVDHGDSRYLFTSADQAAAFRDHPERYLPRYESCPFSLTLGKKVPLDPTNFRIVGGHLLLFHRSDNVDGLVEWDRSELSDAELMRRADKAYTLLRF